MSDEIQVTIGESSVSLTDLAGVDLTDVKEVRSMVTPAGKFHFRIKDASLKAVEATNKEDPQGPKINKPVIQFELESQNCFSLVDDEADPADEIGIMHYEAFWLNDVKKDLGRVKAFLIDIGIDGNKAVSELLAEAHGIEFVCDINNVKNKDNPDIVYANMKNPMTMEAYAESQGEATGDTAAAIV